MKALRGVVFLWAILPAVAPLAAADWYMAGANPQRTSWVPDQVTGALVPKWYRPIEAYIDQKVQLAVVGDRVYVASSRGLYCLDARSGDTCPGWTNYHTEMPLGHTPTVVGGVVYFGSFDRRVHALNATTGQRVWVSSPAGAGFNSNPVVANSMVYAGNRDGYFYSFRTGDGSLAWRFPAAGQPPIGPISYSPAYDAATDTLYFAADDLHAYALRASTGALVWKSSRKLPGDRYRSWWPVIYRDYVVFSGMRPYFYHDLNSTAWADIYTGATLYDYPVGGANEGYLGPVFAAGSANDRTGISWPWPSGSLVMDASQISNRIAANPRLMQVQVYLSRSNGQEFASPYAPYVFHGKHGHISHPPVVMPDGVIYTSGHSNQGSAGIPRAQVLGLQFGTSYVRLAGMETASDEPQYLSGGGTHIYRNLCCSRTGDIANTATSGGGRLTLWGYGAQTLDVLLPGFRANVWYTQPNFLSDVRGWYHGMFRPGYRSPNGHYHNHGDQSPLIPHVTSDGVGRVFAYRNNVILCYGNNGGGYIAQPMLNIAAPTHSDTPVLPPSAIRTRLEEEVAKIVDAPGYLRPAYQHAGQNVVRQINYYFYNPGDMLYTLSRAYPLVSAGLQARLRTYLEGYYNYYFGSTMYAYIGWQEAVPRNANDFPPEALNAFAAAPKSTSLSSPVVRQGFGWSWDYPQNNLYAMWKFAQLFPQFAPDAYNKAKSRIEIRALTDVVNGMTYRDRFREYPYELNGYIAGYNGFLGLSDMVLAQTGTRPDQDAYNRVRTARDSFLVHRASAFEKNSPYTDLITLMPTSGLNPHMRKMNLSRNFMLMTPEVGDYLRENNPALMQETVAEYDYVGPYWFMPAYEAGYQENTVAPLNDYDALFQAKAFVLKESYESLQKYLEAPLFPIGDLFYMNNVIATLEAEGRPSAPRNLRIP